MKKLIAFLLAMIFVLSLAACGDKTSVGNTEEEPFEQSEPAAQNETQQDKPDVESVSVEAVKAAPETPADEFEYWESEGAVTISGYNGAGGVVVIPEKIDGVDVVAIDDGVFANHDTITAVRLPDSLQKVGAHAFENCYGLKVFVSGASVSVLGAYAFNYCTSLEAVELNEGLEVIEVCCFSEMPLREFEIPSTVTELTSAFAGTADSPIVLIAEAGGYVEQFVADLSEDWYVEFRAK